MINFIDKIYSNLRRKNKIESVLRFGIREFSNFIFPFYLRVRRKNVVLNNNNVIVSLTTFPKRIDKVWMVVECVLRQSLTPQKIILWLSKLQFPKELENVPDNLLYYYENQLLDIRFVDEDIRSHKKYFYSLQEFPDSKIVVLDDDIFYPNTILDNLVELSKEFPNSICCLRAYEVIHNSEGVLLPYNKWPKIFNSYGPSLKIFHTSGGGTLYQKKFFDDDLFDKNVFMDICKYADDVWLNIMAQKIKTKTVKSAYFSNLIPIKNSSEKLSDINVFNGANDKQINSVLKHYNLINSKTFI